MGKLSVDFLEPGMELASDVRDTGGMVLLGSGAVITEKHIRIFKSWGVTEVNIKGGDQEAMNTRMLTRLTEEQRDAINRELDRLFRHNDPLDPVIEELRRICLRRETEKAVTVV